MSDICRDLRSGALRVNADGATLHRSQHFTLDGVLFSTTA